MTTNLMWPEWTLVPANVTPFRLVPKNTSGGAAPTGSEQIVGNSPGRYRIVLQDIGVNTGEEERVWRAIAANLRGKSGSIMVPAMTRRTAPWPIVDGRADKSNPCVTLTDDLLFSDGSSAYFTRKIACTTTADLLAGFTDVPITFSAGGPPKAGMVFQAGDFAYEIARVLSTAMSVYTIRLGAPARVDIPSATALEFDNPRFRARLEDDDAMEVALDGNRLGSFSLAFVENV